MLLTNKIRDGATYIVDSNLILHLDFFKLFYCFSYVEMGIHKHIKSGILELQNYLFTI